MASIIKAAIISQRFNVDAFIISLLVSFIADVKLLADDETDELMLWHKLAKLAIFVANVSAVPFMELTFPSIWVSAAVKTLSEVDIAVEIELIPF